MYREKDVLELELEQWGGGGESLGEERNESVKNKDIVHVSEWNDIRR